MRANLPNNNNNNSGGRENCGGSVTKTVVEGTEVEVVVEVADDIISNT